MPYVVEKKFNYLFVLFEIFLKVSPLISVFLGLINLVNNKV